MRTPLLLYLLICTSTAAAQSIDTASQPVYYEAAPEGAIRFYYDDRYYLADKSCPFKAIERVGQYDAANQVFAGEFVDFDNRGRAVLRGQYQRGEKDGRFSAYHANGQLKWTVNFLQGTPQGMWVYYYPDGKPLLEVEYTHQGAYIRNFWDARGRQRVTDGNGRYEFEVEADGYNPYGYIRYNRRGRVVDGRPHGNWIIEYVFDDGKKTGAGHEHYQNGLFVRGYEAFTDEEFSDAPRYHLLPAEVFDRAVLMVSKACTIDEYSGFTIFLEKYLEKWFENGISETMTAQPIEFRITVDRHGESRQIEPVRTFSEKRDAAALLTAFHGINFWFPSYADDGYIEDILTVTADAFPDPAEQRLQVFNIRIERENEQ